MLSLISDNMCTLIIKESFFLQVLREFSLYLDQMEEMGQVRVEKEKQRKSEAPEKARLEKLRVKDSRRDPPRN